MAEDLDTQATREWLDALDSVLEFQGATQANFLLDSLISEALRKGAPVPYSATTPYLNTIPMLRQEPYPGDLAVERRIRSMIRWNAAAIVLRANKTSSELGGHIASSSRRRLCTTLVSNTSGTRRANPTVGIWSTSRPLLAGKIRAAVRRGAAGRGAAGSVPAGGGWGRAVVVSASVADA
jgi:hypothetical protein